MPANNIANNGGLVNRDQIEHAKNEINVSKISKKSDETMGKKIDDASITAQAKMTLLFNRSAGAGNIKVETNEGIVTLGGKARSGAEKDLAAKLVTYVKGVKSVVNNTTVDASMSKND
jgi:hyperosmotically inducible protein